MPRLTQKDFQRLLEFRVTLRRFQRWSEDQAQAEGLTHVQHQLLVAVKGHRGTMPPTVGDLAGYRCCVPEGGGRTAVGGPGRRAELVQAVVPARVHDL